MGEGTVLIVDDDPVVRDVLSEILDSVGGYKTDMAADGSEGLRKLSCNRYDVVFTDLSMPRMNGIDFLREARRLHNSTPIVVITGFSSIENAIRAMKEGAKDFVTKPFNLDKVICLTDKIVGENRQLEKISASGDKETIGRLNSELFCSLYEISIFQAVSSELDGLHENRQICEKIVHMASRLLGLKEASFGIVDGGTLKIEQGTVAMRKEIALDGTIFENVIRTKSHYMALPGEINPHSGRLLDVPFFSIPFMVHDEVFAILNLSGKEDGTAFTDYEVSLALTFAKKAALRIENNALYEAFYNNMVNTLRSLVTSIEARDIYTRRHSERVATYSLEIADVMQLRDDDKDVIRFGGYLHDIGKIGVRDTVLLKPGRLTAEELAEIRLHPVIGDNIIKHIKFFPLERQLIRHHHEDYNGNGYPDGLAADQIPLVVRILKVADTYDAMTSSRPYRKALPHETAVEELQRYSNIQFDGEVVRAFLLTATGKAGNHGI
ncbi:MAG: response regulator [Nitrospiraceae bacterium]|nr:response regulator [Nitrospiraceae bacterium]